MNSKWHAYISFIKSTTRLIGCILTLITNDVKLLALFFFTAEILGIVEEIKDER